MPTARYGYVALRRLWIANGGPKKLADVMAAIALAESRGRPEARHVNTDGTVDQGLWMINSSNYSGSDIYNPNVNARWAIRLATHGRGLRNWVTFTGGQYKKFLRKRKKGEQSVAGSKGFGIFSKANYSGIDQGVDFKGTGPIPALGSGVVTDVGKSSIIEGGSYPYVVYRLTDGPYKDHFVYVAENFAPTVKKGTKLKLGQEVGKAVGSYPYIEVGFNKSGRGWNPVAPLNPNPHSPKPAGEKMWAYIQGVAKLHPGGGGVIGGIESVGGGVASVGGKVIGAVTDPVGTVGGLIGGATGIHPEAWVKDAMYALAVLGGGITAIIGFVILAADIGLSSKAGRTTAEIAAAIPAGRAIGKAARARGNSPATKTSQAKSNIPPEERAARERRAEEKHRADIKLKQAKATEVRTRQKNRRRTKAEQEKAEKSQYYAGARDAASPTMAKIRREKKK